MWRACPPDLPESRAASLENVREGRGRSRGRTPHGPKAPSPLTTGVDCRGVALVPDVFLLRRRDPRVRAAADFGRALAAVRRERHQCHHRRQGTTAPADPGPAGRRRHPDLQPVPGRCDPGDLRRRPEGEHLRWLQHDRHQRVHAVLAADLPDPGRADHPVPALDDEQRPGRREQGALVRQVQGQAADQGHAADQVHRRRRRRRGRPGTRRDPRFPGQPGALPGAGRQDPEGCAAVRAARHRQDAAGPGGGRRGRRAVLLDLRVRLRRDVRRRRRQPGPRPVRTGQGERAGHHLRGRDRRRRPAPRRRHGRRPRRARADPEPVAGRDGRVRGQGRDHPDRGHQPARHPGSGAAASRPLRPADPGRPARPQGPAGDPGRALQGQAVRARTSISCRWPSARSGCPAPIWRT